MRVSDLVEVKAASGEVRLESVRRAVRESVWVKAGIDKRGRAIGMGGVVRLPGDPETGVIWMLATNLARDNMRAIARLPTQVVEEVSRRHGISRFFNYVYAANAASLKWLEHNGFSVRPKERFGAENKWFCMVERSV